MATRPIEGKIVITYDAEQAVRGAAETRDAFAAAGAAAAEAGERGAAGQNQAEVAAREAAQAQRQAGEVAHQAGEATASAGQRAAAGQRQAESAARESAQAQRQAGEVSRRAGEDTASAGQRAAAGQRQAEAAAHDAAKAYEQAGASARRAGDDAQRAAEAAAAAQRRSHPGPAQAPAPAPAATPPAPAPAPATAPAPPGHPAPLTADQERFLRQLRETADLYGKSAAEVLRYRAAQAGVAKEAEASIVALERLGKAGHVSAAQTAQAWQQLPMQLQDVMVSLQGGMSPITVLLQQGPQITSAFGGVGNTLKALGSIITPVRLAMAGLVGVMATVGLAAAQGHEDSTRLTKSLAMTGGAAGATASQVVAMGTQIADAQGVAVGKVRETMQALVDSGAFVGSSLASAGRAVTAIQKITGASSDEIVKDFADMRGGVAAWAVEHNRSYNFLSADQYTYIRSLEAQGRSQEAMRVALDALAGTMEQRSVPAIGSLERAWNSVGAALSGVWDKLKGIGREETAEERLAGLRRKVAYFSEQDGGQGTDGTRRRGTLNAGVRGDAYRDEQRRQAEAELADAEKVAASDAIRAAEKGIAAAQEQERIRQASKQHQDALAQIDLAGSQHRLAQDQAAVQRRASIATENNARGLTSAVAYQTALNRVEQDRLRAQEAALVRQRAVEAKRVEERPEDGLAKQATLKGIDAQLVSVRAGIAQAVSAGRVIVETDELQTQRDRMQQWAAAWKSAADQVRGYAEINAATAATRIANPQERAAAEAGARTAGVRRQLDDQQRELRMQISLTPVTAPNARAELQRQLDALTAQAEQHIAELDRAGRLDSLRAQFSEYLVALQQAEVAIDQMVATGAINAVEAERRKFAERAKALPQLQAIAAAQQNSAQTAGERNDASSAVQQVRQLADQKTEFEKALRGNAATAFSQFFSSVTSGAKTAGQALRDMVGGFAQSMLDLISKRLGEKMVNSVIDAVGKSGGSGPSSGSGSGAWVGAAASWIASFFHTGGVVGGSADGGGRTASLPATVWTLAPRYHTGGVAGLAPDEVPAILRRGEEVLTEGDPRHRRNGGGGGLTIGGIHVSISGAEGGSGEQATAAQDLGGMIETACNAWATRQSRPGGILFKGGR